MEYAYVCGSLSKMVSSPTWSMSDLGIALDMTRKKRDNGQSLISQKSGVLKGSPVLRIFSLS